MKFPEDFLEYAKSIVERKELGMGLSRFFAFTCKLHGENIPIPELDAHVMRHWEEDTEA